MPTYQKPLKKDREDAEKKRLHNLRQYRKEQAAIAVFRDGGRCVICHFKYNIDRKMDDVHHVYGRGRNANDWREGAKHLMCVCREHHPQPIFMPGTNPRLAWVEDTLIKANDDPINPDYKKIKNI